MPDTSKQNRAESMAAKYRAGTTLQEIGDFYDLTRERVRQIINQDFGITAKTKANISDGIGSRSNQASVHCRKT